MNSVGISALFISYMCFDFCVVILTVVATQPGVMVNNVETLFCCHQVVATGMSFLLSLVKYQLNHTGSLLATCLRLVIMLVRPINSSPKGVSTEA